MKSIRFDWDQGNLEHTARHGVSASEIEYLFYNDPMVSPDPYPENVGARWPAIGNSESGRTVLVVFMFRAVEDEICIRPISARYMHKKEIESCEQR